MTIIFFGSFQSYSVQVLEKLVNNFDIKAVITTPPKPAGRHLEIKKTEVQEFAEKNNLKVYPLASLKEIPPELEQSDFIVTAGYGKLIPDIWLDFPKIMAVNIHFSLLPFYRGAFPAEWAILHGETETGVTLIKMSQDFDKGEILAQKKFPILESDNRETLYHKLYDLGGEMAVKYLPQIASGEIKPISQPAGNYFYAKKITRADGFEPWEEIKKALKNNNEAIRIEHKFRALYPWPGLWTILNINNKETRLKILKLSIIPLENLRTNNYQLSIETVQLEGKKPMKWNEFKLVCS